MIEGNKIKRFLFRIFSKFFISDAFAQAFPISVKGIIIINGKVLLLKNNLGLWDLPGGKIKEGEEIKFCLKREVQEELNLEVEVKDLISVGMEKVLNKVNVFLVLYDCELISSLDNLKISFEHDEYKFFSFEEINQLNISKIRKEGIIKNNNS